jgi:hypothetical protein
MEEDALDYGGPEFTPEPADGPADMDSEVTQWQMRF